MDLPCPAGSEGEWAAGSTHLQEQLKYAGDSVMVAPRVAREVHRLSCSWVRICEGRDAVRRTLVIEGLYLADVGERARDAK